MKPEEQLKALVEELKKTGKELHVFSSKNTNHPSKSVVTRWRRVEESLPTLLTIAEDWQRLRGALEDISKVRLNGYSDALCKEIVDLSEEVLSQSSKTLSTIFPEEA